MRMHDSADVGTRGVKARVNPELRVRLAVTCEHVAVGVDREQIALVREPG